MRCDLEGIPAIPRRIEGVLNGITVKEKDAGIWKASVRAFLPGMLHISAVSSAAAVTREPQAAPRQ